MAFDATSTLMRWLIRLRLRLRSLFRRRRVDQDLESELQQYADERAERYVAQGMAPADATAAARRSLGNLTRLRESTRETRGLDGFDLAIRELRVAARRLLAAPAFTVAAIATLALAIGANAAIFTIVQRVVLNPLPYEAADRLIDLDHGATVFNAPRGIGMKIGLYRYYGDRARTLDALAVYAGARLTLSGRDGPERVLATRTTVDLADVLGVQPAVGRWFTEAEGRPGARPVAVISHGLWSRRFGRSPQILGRAIILDGIPTEVIGVMPSDYAFPTADVAVWLAEPVSESTGLGIWTYRGVARMRDGVTVADVRAELNDLIAAVPEVFADDPLAAATGPDVGTTSTAVPLKDTIVGDASRALWLLFGSVIVVLLVAAANVANLFLVRVESRQREVAVRRALGASRNGIARVFLAESTLISVVGGLVGLAVAWGTVRVLVSAAPATLPRLEEVRVDAVVVAFTVGLIAFTALALGSTPLWRAAPLASALGDGGRWSTSARGRHRTRHLLMGGQVALALVLLAASGLTFRSVQNLRALDPGFAVEGASTFQIGLPRGEYPSRDAAVAAHQAILDAITARPGVTGASASTCLPLAGNCFGNGVRVEGRPTAQGFGDASNVSLRAVAGDYFDTLGVLIVRGRGIDRGDIERNEPVAVVDTTFADVIFPNEDPIGHRVASSVPPRAPDEAPRLTWLTIVGVVASTPARVLGDPRPAPQLYLPMSLTGEPDGEAFDYIGPTVETISYVVRSTLPARAVLSSVRQALDTVDRNLAMAQTSTLRDRVDRAADDTAFTMVLLATAATVAVLMGLVGVYGVVSYVASQRTTEIGVRLALGADPSRVTRTVLRQGATVALAGAGLGLGLALATGRLLESLLYDVSTRDPLVLILTTAGLLGVTLVACWLPAYRASRIDPLKALRVE